MACNPPAASKEEAVTPGVNMSACKGASRAPNIQEMVAEIPVEELEGEEARSDEKRVEHNNI